MADRRPATKEHEPATKTKTVGCCSTTKEPEPASNNAAAGQVGLRLQLQLQRQHIERARELQSKKRQGFSRRMNQTVFARMLGHAEGGEGSTVAVPLRGATLAGRYHGRAEAEAVEVEVAAGDKDEGPLVVETRAALPLASAKAPAETAPILCGAPVVTRQDAVGGDQEQRRIESEVEVSAAMAFLMRPATPRVASSTLQLAGMANTAGQGTL